MAELTTADLERIRAAQSQRLAFRDRTYLLICGGTGCHATGSIRVKDALVAATADKNLTDIPFFAHQIPRALHNKGLIDPESIDAYMRFDVDPEACTRCGMCFKACPADAIAWKKKDVARIDKEK